MPIQVETSATPEMGAAVESTMYASFSRLMRLASQGPSGAAHDHRVGIVIKEHSQPHERRDQLRRPDTSRQMRQLIDETPDPSHGH